MENVEITLDEKIEILGFATDYWALHSTTGLFTRLLGFSPDYWAFHSTTGLFTRLLGFAPDYWALHSTTGLLTRLLGCFMGPGTVRNHLQTTEDDDKFTRIMEIVENGLIWLGLS